MLRLVAEHHGGKGLRFRSSFFRCYFLPNRLSAEQSLSIKFEAGRNRILFRWTKTSIVHVKLKLCFAIPGSQQFFFVTYFSLAILRSLNASGSLFHSIELAFRLIKFRFMNQKFFSNFSASHLSSTVWKFRFAFSWVFCAGSMETLHVDGQSIKFVDRKLWKRDSFDGKLNFEGKMFTPSTGDVGSDRENNRTIRRKCPIEIDYPRKRRILKRPKRFKTYYSDREPLSIPRFSFPRCLIGK